MQKAPSTGETGKTVGWALVFYTGAKLAGYFLASNDVGAAAVQAALSEWGAGRAGISWSDPRVKAPTWGSIGRRAASGAGLGFGVAVLALVVLLVTHGASLAKSSPLGPSLAVGLLVAGLAAVRDELLLRGFVLRALQGWPTSTVSALVCGVAAAAARFGTGGATPVELAVAGVGGVALAAVWQRDRGAWMAVGANLAFTFTTRTLFHDAFFDVRFAPGAWGGGDAEAAGSAAALAVLVAVAAVALVLASRASQDAVSDPATPR